MSDTLHIIDFEKKGNLVRFYLGYSDDYGGDDWDDVPYEFNAEPVDDKYISEYWDIVFPFDCNVLEPQTDWKFPGGSPWCKDDMKRRKVPCIIVVPDSEDTNGLYDDCFTYWLGNDRVKKIYFGDGVEALNDFAKLEKMGPAGSMLCKILGRGGEKHE